MAAVPYALLANQPSPAFTVSEKLICGAILQIASERLADKESLEASKELLKGHPADQIKAMKKVFSLTN